MFFGPRAPKGCRGKARSAVNIDVSKHWSKIVKNRRFKTIFTSNQAPKDDIFFFFVHFEVKAEQKSSPKRIKIKSQRFHAIMLSNIHTLVHSYFHILILPYSYTLILSYAHPLLLSYIHTLILSYQRTLVLSYPRTLLFSRAKPPTSARSARVRPPHTSMRWRFRTLVIS